ncbi:acetyl-CoA acetyltransferase [Hyphococcus formosus]|uniref:acetyl-CoA acetyltransferase n=1 Tax=Hyphococcus formosus TaxID=3143534 RepID=UPI00398A65A8
MTTKTFVLGGYQTDFSRNWAREGLSLFDMFKETVEGGLNATGLEPDQINAAHVGNFTSELFCNQGHLGGFFTATDWRFDGMPAQRHEAACASGSMAMMSAMAEIEAGRYDLIAVLGIEMMRNVPGDQAAKFIGGPAMWADRECTDVKYPWPHIFSELADEYDHRYGLKFEHLAGISKINFDNARRNPNAQSRNWTFTDESFQENDEANPLISGRIRRSDCGQVTDGAAVVFLASERAAREYAQKHGKSLENIARIDGWGHRTSHISYKDKIEASRNGDYVVPNARRAIEDAFARANISIDDLSGIETHDCFTSNEYMAIDHFGITAPGESWKAIENGDIAMGGRIPVNPSGGLIGLGHPVGATGVRMMLDCAKQVTGTAGDYQVEGANKFGILNIGGSCTTVASFVVAA